MGSICCCKESDHDGWYFSTESVPPLDIDCKLDWTNTPYNSPMDEQEIAKLFSDEYRSYNKYKM